MAENTYTESIDFLVNARDDLKNYDAMADQLDDLKSQEKKLSRNIASEDKSITNEIANTIKKRRQDIIKTFDDRLDDNRSRRKSTLNSRNKKKAQRMNARIEEETSDYVRDNKHLDSEMNTMLKKNNVTTFVGTKIYSIMFMPSVSEYLFALLALAIYFAGIPALLILIAKGSFMKKAAGWAVTVFGVLVVVALALLYILIFKNTKIEHPEVIKEARSIRNKMNANKRKVKSIKNSISKDEDESMYNLSAYDEKLAEFDAEAEKIAADKTDALQEFEEDTTKRITDEINEKRLPKLEEMQAGKAALDAQIQGLEQQFDQLASLINEKYKPVFGEELCDLDSVNNLITYMSDERAKTVSEAIALHTSGNKTKE